MHLFTYGSLMFPEVWRIVVGRKFKTTAAALPGYQIFRVRDALYPGIIAIDPSPSRRDETSEPSAPLTPDLRPLTSASSVPGRLYFNLDPASLERLDRFEGEDYVRIPVEVSSADGQRLTADAYMIPHESRHLLTDEPWTAEEFAASGHLERFIAKYSGFTRLD